MVRVSVFGAKGRMGQRIQGLIAEDGQCALHRGLDRGDDLSALAGSDVVIDFSLPEGTAQVVEACLEQGVPLVSGTTGLDGVARARLETLARQVAVVWAPNMSPGVNVLFRLASQAAKALGPGYDAEIVEMHHRHKVDAPGGTAVRLAEVVSEAKGMEYPRDANHGRRGAVGARPDREVGVMSLRGGDVVGDHTLILAGPQERIELVHRAHDRGVFAAGAVRAAQWVVNQSPGLYGMADVLGLQDA